MNIGMEEYWGFDLGGTKLRLETRLRSFQWSTGPGFTPNDLRAAIQAAIGASPTRPRAIGLSIPGLVNGVDQVVASDVLPQLNGMKSRDLGLDVPLFLIHDLKAATWQMLNMYPKAKFPICVMVGTGIAMGWASEGQVRGGANGWAGELGSLIMEPQPIPQTLDQLASGAAILSRWNQDAASLQAAIQQADVRACSIVQSAGTALGRAISHLIHIFNPDQILCSGGTLRYPGYEQAMRQSAQAYTLAPMWESCPITVAADDANLVGKGAARFAEIQLAP